MGPPREEAGGERVEESPLELRAHEVYCAPRGRSQPRRSFRPPKWVRDRNRAAGHPDYQGRHQSSEQTVRVCAAPRSYPSGPPPSSQFSRGPTSSIGKARAAAHAEFSGGSRQGGERDEVVPLPKPGPRERQLRAEDSKQIGLELAEVVKGVGGQLASGWYRGRN